MREPDLRKRLLIERVETSRELLRLEVDAVAAKLSPARALLKAGTGLLPTLLPVAATAAGAVRGRAAGHLGGLSGVAGLAALVPVVFAVAKLVGSRGKRSKSAANLSPDPGADTDADPVAGSADAAPGEASDDATA